jgi:WD40 repeat protein
MISLSCAEILVEPALENKHDPLSPLFVPGSPAGLAAHQKSDKAIELSWVGGSHFASAVRIERRASGQAFQFLGTIHPDSTRFVDTTGVLSGTTYGYRIGKLAANGNVGYSGELPFSMTFPPPVITESGDTARVFVRLKWTDASGFAAGYIIERSNGTGTFAEIGRRSRGSESYVDVTADTNNASQYRLRAFTSLNTSAPSPTVSLRFLLETQQIPFSIPNWQIGAASPDGKIIACVGGGSSGEIRLFSLETGGQLKVIVTTSPGLHSVAFSPDGSLLVVGGVDSLRIWDVSSGMLKVSSPGFMEHVCFDQTGNVLAISCPSASTVQIWDPRTLTMVKQLPGGVEVAISPDGNTIASLVSRPDGNGFAMEIRDVASEAIVGSYGSGYAWGNQLSFDPTGKVLVSSRFDHVFVTRVTDGAILFQSPTGGYWSSVDVNSAGTYFVGADMDGPVIAWSLHSFQQVARISLDRTNFYRVVRFLHDGTRFVVGTSAGIGVWSIGPHWTTN